MYLNLNAGALGVSGRQSELIELALTYGFKGFDLDFVPLVKQVDLHGYEHAARFIESANIKIGGFDLPVRWQGDDSDFHEDLDRLSKLGEIAARLGATGCRTVVMPASVDRPYHENFEFHRQRFTKIAEVLLPHSIRLGLDFLATAPHREGLQHQFIHSPDALMTLAKTVGVDNIGVAVDVWQWLVSGGSWEPLRELSADEIVHVRIADVPKGVATDSISDDQRVLPSADDDNDISALMNHLQEISYTGPVTPFPHPSQFSGQTRETMVRMAGSSIRIPSKVVQADVDDNASLVTTVEGETA